MAHLMNTYSRLPIAFTHGKGALLFDEQGNEYLDALAGIAVNGLGHAHPRLVSALTDQVSRLIHTSNVYRVREQEQLAELKAWWQKYGNMVLTAVTAVLLAFAAYNGWRWYEREQARSAAGIYGQLEQAVQARDAAKVQTLASSIVEHYGRSIYAVLGALQAAKLNAESGDLPKAVEQLRWVIDKSGHEELAMIARVRLAGVLLDDKQFDAALAALNVPIAAGQATAVFDRRGDIYLVQGKFDEARSAYKEALDKADPQHPLRMIVQLKLDSLPVGAT